MSPLKLNQDTNSSFTPYPSSLCHCGFMLRCIKSPPDQSAERESLSLSPFSSYTPSLPVLLPRCSLELIPCTLAATH